MGQNAHLSWNRSEFIDNLMQDVSRSWPIIGRLSNQLTSALYEDDPVVVQRYFLLYTTPVLEISGFTSSADWDHLYFWGLVQTRLGIHLRYLDNIVDGDTNATTTAAVLLASHRLLTDAKRLLGEQGLRWECPHDDVYGQFLAFESENRSGFRHDFDSLWRRVSPLCVVPEIYLSEFIPNQLVLAYREYLAWSLLQADCDDSLKDYKGGVRTPVTQALHTSISGVHLDWLASAQVIGQIRGFLRHRYEDILLSIGAYPIWMTVLRHLDEAFVHEEMSP